MNRPNPTHIAIIPMTADPHRGCEISFITDTNRMQISLQVAPINLGKAK